jgi:hypothetical protein
MDDLRTWLFRAMMFEADAEELRSSGIRIGADQREFEQSLMEETLRPFSIDLRNNALRMSRLYALIYCFENAIRQLIRERLEEEFGGSWWDDRVPAKIRTQAESRQKKDNENSWLEGQTGSGLLYIEFGQLADIIIANWSCFEDVIPTQHWVKQRLDEIEQARNFIAHNRLLLPGEFARIEVYVGDWNRQVGV